MSTEDALLRVIRDMPDEDTPRLAYADYLDEEGGASNAARAELIRLQVERARLPEYDPRRYPLEDREHELLAEHEYSWLGVDPADMDELTEWEFERGFVEEVAASPFFMRVPGAELCRAHPVRRWRVQSGQDNMVEDLRDAGQRGWFARLRALDLAGWFTTIGELNSFFWNADFSHLRELDLTDRPGLNDLPHVLTDTPLREQLKVLRCGGAMYGEGGRLDCAALAAALGPKAQLEELGIAGTLITADDLRDLIVADCCHALTSLDVRDNQIAPDGWDAFRFARCRLRELDISSTPLGAIAFDRLHELPAFSTLARLHLNGCGSAMANMQSLARSRYWAQADELRMQHGTIPEASLDPLFATGGPRRLRILDVAGNYVRDGGVRQLCDAPWADSIVYLDLSRNYLTDESLHTLAKSGRFKQLHTLHLNFNSPYHQDGADPHERLTDAGFRALAECPGLANLRVLSVSGTHITAAGVDALLNGPHWRLTALRLSHCHLGPGAAEVLASSPRLSRLEVLDLSENPLVGTALAPLAESQYLSPRTELNLSRNYIGIDASICHTLRQRLGRRLSD